MNLRRWFGRATLPCLSLVVAFLVSAETAAHDQRPAPAPTAIAYRIDLEQGGGRESWWGVTAPTQGVMQSATGTTALLDGAAVGGAPATVVSIAGREAYLADAWRAAPRRAVGHRIWSPIADSGTAVLDSLRFDLAEIGAGPTIEGHATRHAVATVQSWWTSEGGAGPGVAFRASGHADLFLAGDLPFSWLPIAATPRESPEAMPLTEWMPGVASRVALALGPRLHHLGFLLRARVWDSLTVIRHGGDRDALVGGHLSRTITIDSIVSDAVAPPVRDYAGLARLSERRSELVQRAVHEAIPECMRGLAGESGAFELKTSGPVAITTTGNAFVTDNGRSLVMGRVGEETQCLLVSLPVDARAGTSLPIVATSPGEPDGSSGAPGATALYLDLDPAHRRVHRVAVVELGTLSLEQGTAGGLRGTLSGTGWSLELVPEDRHRVADNTGFHATFEAAPGGA